MLAILVRKQNISAKKKQQTPPLRIESGPLVFYSDAFLTELTIAFNTETLKLLLVMLYLILAQLT